MQSDNSICPRTPSAISGEISKTYILLRCGVVMPKRITDRPIQPKRRRRGGFHLITYEAVFMLMLLPVAFVSVVFLSSYPVENWGISAERALILAKVLAVAFLVITMLLIRFDKLSVIREKESFDFAMKEYEMLRSKWIDTEAKRMDSESQEMFSESASKGKVSANIISSGDIIVATPEEVGITSDSAADVSEDD
jgi:hypothetical protein